MKLLHEISILGGGKFRKIQLYYGDLTQLETRQDVDLLVVSAFPNNYDPTEGTLIKALHDKGLSVQELAQQKCEDMTSELGCWFSHELSKEQQQVFHFKRLLCFEPMTQSQSATEVVGNIFRCVNNFIFDNSLNHIAMPIVASGNQKFPLEDMCEALLEAAIFWLKKGLPLQTIKLVHRNEETIGVLEKVFQKYVAETAAQWGTTFQVDGTSPQAGASREDLGTQAHIPSPAAYPSSPKRQLSIIEKLKEKLSGFIRPKQTETVPPSPAPSSPVVVSSSTASFSPTIYDVFVSYSHKQKPAADSFVRELRKCEPSLSVFYDDNSIPKGAQWLKLISEAIDASRKVVVFISPEYTQSKICWDEFQCAKVREYNSDVQLLITIYLRSHDKLPTIFQLNNYIDCREADEEKIRAACKDVLAALA